MNNVLGGSSVSIAGNAIPEPDGAPGSLLGEIQALDNAINGAFSSFRTLVGRIGPVLTPEMKQTGDQANVPEPIRSEFSSRVHDQAIRLKQLIGEIETVTNRVSLT